MWQDLDTIKGHSKSKLVLLDNELGREIIYPGALCPQLVDYINYDRTDFQQAPYNTDSFCPANLETNSAALRFFVSTISTQSFDYDLKLGMC